MERTERLWADITALLRQRHEWEQDLQRLIARHREIEALHSDILRHVLELRAMLGEGPPREPGAAPPAEPGRLGDRVAAYERALILEALDRCGGQQKHAAAILGVLPSTLSEKLKRLGIECRKDRTGDATATYNPPAH